MFPFVADYPTFRRMIVLFEECRRNVYCITNKHDAQEEFFTLMV